MIARRISAGHWRDYAIDLTREVAIFSAFRRSAERPEVRIEKRPLLRHRQGMWALIGETGFFASYKFRPNLIGRASYDFMWVTGMALAPEQLQFTTFRLNHVNNNGTILYHGITLSMEWLW